MKRALCIAVVLCLAGLASAQTSSKSSTSDKKLGKDTPTNQILMGKKHKWAATSIQVLEFRPSDIKVPAQFEMAMYENTIVELQKLKKFKNVYRDGDKRAAADPDCVKLKALIWQFKEGSARQRQVTTVSGATTLHVTVHVEDAKGQALVDKDVAGAVHFMGENLKATNDLAKNVAALVDSQF